MSTTMMLLLLTIAIEEAEVVLMVTTTTLLLMPRAMVLLGPVRCMTVPHGPLMSFLYYLPWDV